MRWTNGAITRRRLDLGARSVVRRRLSPPQLAVLRWSGLVFLASRVFVVAVGVVAVLLLGTGDGDGDPPGDLLEPFGRLGDLFVASSARWDSSYYLLIATEGYDDPTLAAFFPLYPLAVRALMPLTESFVSSDLEAALVAGIVVSCAAFLVALVLLHRLVSLDFDEGVARRTVVLVAVFPTAFFFSAVYGEALFLAVSVGAVYAARRGHWALAGLLGALGALNRAQGVVLLVPLVALLLYGPRDDRVGVPRVGWRWPYTLLSRQAAWLLLVPAGLGAFIVYAWLTQDDILATLHAQRDVWHRHSVFPLVGAWQGLWDGAWAANQVRVGANPFTNGPVRASLTDVAFLGFAIVTLLGGLRRLPVAYSAYAVASIVLPLSSVPEGGQRLLSMPRFVLVLFPLFIWLALWTNTPRRWWLTVGVSGVLLAFYTGLFATWHFVA